MTARRNPLTDELTDDAKQELAAVFAGLRQRYERYDQTMRRRGRRGVQDGLPAWVRPSDQPHTLRRHGW